MKAGGGVDGDTPTRVRYGRDLPKMGAVGGTGWRPDRRFCRNSQTSALVVTPTTRCVNSGEAPLTFGSTLSLAGSTPARQNMKRPYK